jgi:hypothetical protein
VKAGNRLAYTFAGLIGEFRGWSGDGRAALCIQSDESDSIDAFETSNATIYPQVLANGWEVPGTMTTVIDGRAYTQPANGTWDQRSVVHHRARFRRPAAQGLAYL